jgi:hypothetical protein
MELYFQSSICFHDMLNLNTGSISLLLLFHFQLLLAQLTFIINLFSSCGEAKLSPMALRSQMGPLPQLRITWENGALVEWELAWKTVPSKPASVPFCLPQIQDGLSWERPRVSVVTIQQLTSWARHGLSIRLSDTNTEMSNWGKQFCLRIATSNDLCLWDYELICRQGRETDIKQYENGARLV